MKVAIRFVHGHAALQYGYQMLGFHENAIFDEAYLREYLELDNIQAIPTSKVPMNINSSRSFDCAGQIVRASKLPCRFRGGSELILGFWRAHWPNNTFQNEARKANFKSCTLG